MGVTNNAYRVKKNPVNVNAVYCGNDILFVGRSNSKNDAPEMNHLDIGALIVVYRSSGGVVVNTKSKQDDDFFSIVVSDMCVCVCVW